MRKLYLIEYDEKTGKIITDEYMETEHNCWTYYFSKPDSSGYVAWHLMAEVFGEFLIPLDLVEKVED